MHSNLSISMCPGSQHPQGQSAQAPNKPQSSHSNNYKEKPSTGKGKGGYQAATKWDWSKNCPATSSKAQQGSQSASKGKSGGNRTPVTSPLKDLNKKTTLLTSPQSPYPKVCQRRLYMHRTCWQFILPCLISLNVSKTFASSRWLPNGFPVASPSASVTLMKQSFGPFSIPAGFGVTHTLPHSVPKA